jgi:hypothetical protein
MHINFNVPWFADVSNNEPRSRQPCYQTKRVEPTVVIMTAVEGGAYSETQQKIGGRQIQDQANGSRLTLLNLPLEIREQIYGWIYLMHPIKPATLAPWYPTPGYSSYHLQRVAAEIPNQNATRFGGAGRDRIARNCDKQHLLSPYRPVCGFPSSFLRASRQIYQECRMIPFHQNEFVFVNWFSSGLWAARAFTKALRPWQRNSTQYIRLELLVRDLAGAGLAEWAGLCEFWAVGLRGLRLKVQLSWAGSITVDESKMSPAEREIMSLEETGACKEWIHNGLKKLLALRELDIELVLPEWESQQKVEWTQRLERILNEDRANGWKVRVACCKRADARNRLSEGAGNDKRS